MRVQELLTEHLGNLAALKVGKMIDVLRQHVSSNRKYDQVSSVGNKFMRSSMNDIGTDSEIIDYGPVKDLVGIRKAYKKHDHARAFALYVDGKAVAFGKFDDYAMGGVSRQGILAYDLSMFQDKVVARHAAAFDKLDAWQKIQSHNQTEPDIRSRKTETDSYGTRKRSYEGELYSVGRLKGFMEELVELADGKPITMKLVGLDDVAWRKNNARRDSERLTKAEIFTGLEALRDRLTRYKISKKPTVDTIEQFLEMVKKNVKVVQFGGRGFTTVARDEEFSKVSQTAILRGTPFMIMYKSVEPGAHDGIKVWYSYDAEDMSLKAYKAQWMNNASPSPQTAILDKTRFLHKEHGLNSTEKPEVMKKLLTLVKDGEKHKAKALISSLRKAGHDFPEFAVVEKSLQEGMQSIQKSIKGMLVEGVPGFQPNYDLTAPPIPVLKMSPEELEELDETLMNDGQNLWLHAAAEMLGVKSFDDMLYADSETGEQMELDLHSLHADPKSLKPTNREHIPSFEELMQDVKIGKDDSLDHRFGISNLRMSKWKNVPCVYVYEQGFSALMIRDPK